MTTLHRTFERSSEYPDSADGVDMDMVCINTIRTLSMDAVQKAKSGHPGTPMGMAGPAYALWQNVFNYDPAFPLWPGRDRFVLSIGHASMLLYSLLYLTGVKDVVDGYPINRPSLTLDDLKAFRQLDSKTPGHPEYRHTTGVETTTGPLGQGCGNSVGMAIAQKWLSTKYDRPSFPLFDYYIYTFCGDGDMMEGVTSEAASLAGHLQLGNLIWVYDANRISIEGSTDLALTEDVGKRFEAYKWHVTRVEDANNIASFQKKLLEAKNEKDRPSLIIVSSVIAYGAPTKAGKASAHGEPLGDEEVRGAKRAYGFPEDKSFYVPDGVMNHFQQGFSKRGAAARQSWEKLLQDYQRRYPDLAKEVNAILAHRLPDDWKKNIPVFEADSKGMATRASSGKVQNMIAEHYPWIIGGAADLSPSTKTNMTFADAGSFQPVLWGGTYEGRNLHFGVREHAMGSVCNGIALSGIKAFCSGFFIFSDYMKPPIRLSAIMGLPVIYIFTHDSIGVGEDGPTHQPIEQLAQFRAMPGLTMIRPCDANEVAEAWRYAIPQTKRPIVLVLSRQDLPTLDRKQFAAVSGLRNGAYVLSDCQGQPDVILIASGSEISLVIQAMRKLKEEGVLVRIVSMPSWDLFEAQSKSYRDSVLPPNVTARVAVEMGASLGWERYVGLQGSVIAMHSFGASAPLAGLLEKFGFTVDAVVEAAHRQIANTKK